MEATFFSNTSTLLNSGVPLIKTLEALAGDESFKKSASTLEALVRDIRSGSSFSEALSKHPDCFSPLVVSLIRAGEKGGTLVSALQEISENIEKRQAARTEIRKALTYPTIVVVLGGGAVCFLMAFVVPVFEETYSKAGMPLPMVTQALIAISGVVSKTWWMVMGLGVIAVLMYRRLRGHPRLRMFRDRLMLRVPLLGQVVRGIMVGRFVQAFGGLLAAGVSIKESLAMTERVVNHSEYADLVGELRLAVTRGEGIGRKLGEYPALFPPLLTQMITLGEQSGDLGNMLKQIAIFVEKDLVRRTQRLSTLIEPIVTVGMALAIGTIALAIYLPIFDMFKQVDH